MKLLSLLLTTVLCSSAPAQMWFPDCAKIETRTQTIWAVWTSAEAKNPVILPGFGLNGPNSLSRMDDGDLLKKDHLSAQYVTKEGTVITVFVSCENRTSKLCADIFKRRYEMLTNLLPPDWAKTLEFQRARGYDQ